MEGHVQTAQGHTQDVEEGGERYLVKGGWR